MPRRVGRVDAFPKRHSTGERRYTGVVRFALSVVLAAVCCAQTKRDVRLCADVVAQLPASHEDEELPLARRARFELRQCPEGNIQVYGYRRNAATATMRFDTIDDWPLQIVRVQNVLLLISHGASTNHVFVFEFNAGAPHVALDSGSKADMPVRVEDGRLQVNVPEPDEDDPPSHKLRDHWYTYPSSR
jgi:hypothetical protein